MVKVSNKSAIPVKVDALPEQIDTVQVAKSGAGVNAGASAGPLAVGIKYDNTKSVESTFRECEPGQLILPGKAHKFDTRNEPFLLNASFTKNGKRYGFQRRCRGWKVSKFYISEKHTATDDLLNQIRPEDVADYEQMPPDLDRRFALQEKKLGMLTAALAASVALLLLRFRH